MGAPRPCIPFIYDIGSMNDHFACTPRALGLLALSTRAAEAVEGLLGIAGLTASAAASLAACHAPCTG